MIINHKRVGFQHGAMKARMTKKSFLQLMAMMLTFIFTLLTSLSPAAAGAHGYLIQPMMSPFGRRRRYRSRRRYRTQPRGPSHPTSMYNYQSHFLDQKNWLTDKKIRIWDGQSSHRRVNQRSWTGLIVLANIFCYGLQTFNPKFTQWGVKLSERILAGQDLYRLITPVFLHGGLYHLFTNMYSLNNVGPITEQVFGPGRFLASYLVAGASGNLLSAINSPNPALGASGAVFGVMASLFVFLNRNDWLMGSQGEEYSRAITQTLLINLVMGAVNPMVDNWGHIGGAIGGAAMSYYFGPRLYYAELPGGIGKVIVDKPIARLPLSIESIPRKMNEEISRLTRRIQIWQYFTIPDKPWRLKKNQQQKIDNRRRQIMTPIKSIKPRLD
mmetsp:Transcript_22768/g.25411  ORF Transcript_22768/g.25411 Transcript_22768/m.25411 type:complete len:384 (+) Transcript_22768:154-1305(+)